jgi:NAD(P)-dependent dehydrogenase (short-subunit alcohol dehydrogenase family)
MTQGQLRTAVVTGATAGIGRAIAVALGGLGWRVAIGARRAERLADAEKAIIAAGGEAFGHALDVSQPDSIERFFAAVEARFGCADVVVNNAGGARAGRIDQLPFEAIRNALETTLLGSLFVSKRAIAALRARGLPGDLVFVSSRSATESWPNHVPYGAAKAGVENAARALRLELEGTGIRVSLLRVGDTADTEFMSGVDPAEIMSNIGVWQRYALLRHGGYMRSEDVARAVVLAVTTAAGVQLEVIGVDAQAPVSAPQGQGGGAGQ